MKQKKCGAAMNDLAADKWRGPFCFGLKISQKRAQSLAKRELNVWSLHMALE